MKNSNIQTNRLQKIKDFVKLIEKNKLLTCDVKQKVYDIHLVH